MNEYEQTTNTEEFYKLEKPDTQVNTTLTPRSLAWRTPWTEEPGELYSPWGCKESDVTEAT